MDSGQPRYYRPELDALRFLAFLLVFIAHTLTGDPQPSISRILKNFTPVYDASVVASTFGLSLFFALSAFLICELLLRERTTIGTVEVKQFYFRRILRIWPLYYLGLALGVAVALLPDGHPYDIAAIGWFAVFLSTWIIPAHGFIGNPVSPLWSISVEEQFYAVVPWLIKYFSRRLLYGFCAAVIVVSNAFLFYLGGTRAPIYRIWENSFVQFEAFAAGILLCLVLRGRLPAIPMWQRLIVLSLGWSCWFFSCYRLHTMFDRGQNPGGLFLAGGYGLAALGSVLFLIAFLGLDARLIPRWAIHLGRISFGLYVYHEFAIYVSNALARHIDAFPIQSYFLKALRAVGFTVFLPLGLTVLAAMLSYRFYETPFLKMKRRHALIDSQPIA